MAWEGFFTWKIGEAEIEEYINNQQENIYPELNASHEYEWSISDYIIEAHTVKLQKDYIDRLEGERQGNEPRTDYNNARINEAMLRIFEYDIQLQQGIEIVKKNILYADTLRQYRDYGDLADELSNLLEGILDYAERLPNLDFPAEPIPDYIRNGLQNYINYYEGTPLGTVFEYIDQWIDRIGNLPDITEHEIQVFVGDLNRQIRKIPVLFSEESKKRYKLLKKFSKIRFLDGLYDDHDNLLMSLSAIRFNDGIDGVIDETANLIQEIQHISISFNEVIFNQFQEKLRQIENLIKGIKREIGTADGKKILRKYEEGAGCFGIMVTANDTYFALSGINDYDGASWNQILFTSNEIDRVANLISVNVFGNDIIWARLSDDTRRYTELLNKDSKIIEIDASVSLGNDVGNIKGNTYEDVKEVVGITYGCCERKMQAANAHDFTSDKMYFARWSPCPKCIPAILQERGNIRIFAIAKDFHEFKEMKKNNTLPSCLQEYAIKPSLRRVK